MSGVEVSCLSRGGTVNRACGVGRVGGGRGCVWMDVFYIRLLRESRGKKKDRQRMYSIIQLTTGFHWFGWGCARDVGYASSCVIKYRAITRGC